MIEQNKLKFILAAAIVLICGFVWLWGDSGRDGDRQTAYSFETNDSDGSSSGFATANPEAPAPDGKIYIHIIGAVKKPGVYIFDENPRVIEVVECAGGFTKDARKSEINQAEILEDGCQIRIESKKDKKKENTGGDSAEQDSDSERVNINTATKEELMTLTGIGEAKAMSIIEYRETNGKFGKIEDVMNIAGIKDGVFEKIRDQIKVR